MPLSATGATLDTGGWLALAPVKKRQVSLGAPINGSGLAALSRSKLTRYIALEFSTRTNGHIDSLSRFNSSMDGSGRLILFSLDILLNRLYASNSNAILLFAFNTEIAFSNDNFLGLTLRVRRLGLLLMYFSNDSLVAKTSSPLSVVSHIASVLLVAP